MNFHNFEQVVAVFGDNINEDDFFVEVFIVNKLFSNHKFTGNQIEAFLIDSFS